MGFKSFTEIPVWRDSHQIVLDLYKLTKSFPKHELFGSVSQLRRSSASIPANIVEGFYKQTTKELIRHLYHARGSCGESIYHIILARDLAYISAGQAKDMIDKLDNIAKQINGWIKSLDSKALHQESVIRH